MESISINSQHGTAVPFVALVNRRITYGSPLFVELGARRDSGWIARPCFTAFIAPPV